MTGYWNHDIPFDTDDLFTVVDVINEQQKAQRSRQ